MLTDLNGVLSKRTGAIGAINTPNAETVRAVIEAAEELNVPVIISHAQLHDEVAPIDFIGPLMVDMAKRSKVDVCVHLDHGEDIGYIRRAADIGFTSVMYDCSALCYDENLNKVKDCVSEMHKRNITVEAELGRLSRSEGGKAVGAAEYTDPGLAESFADETGVDALAIAFGTAHGIYDKPPILSFDIISDVKKRIKTPLVMHGGSGIGTEAYREAIRRGIAKINYYTYMSYEGFDAAAALAAKQKKGFFHDMADAAYRAMRKNAYGVLSVFSFNGSDA